ncbi:uncharacterized [Tachysurus ichikawai]
MERWQEGALFFSAAVKRRRRPASSLDFFHKETKRRQDVAPRVFRCRGMEEEVNRRSCKEHLGASPSDETETAVGGTTAGVLIVNPRHLAGS